MAKEQKWRLTLFHEEGVLNARTTSSDIVHIADDDGKTWKRTTLCGRAMTGRWVRKFPIRPEWKKLCRCKKCEERYHNRIGTG